MNQFWTFKCIFLNNFKDFLEAYSLLKICKIVLEHTLKCSQLISSSDNKKILLTTRNVRLDSGHYATKYYFSIFTKYICRWKCLKNSPFNFAGMLFFLQLRLHCNACRFFSLFWKKITLCALSEQKNFADDGLFQRFQVIH